MSAITIDDDLVHYEVLGRGKPIIFIHGWLGSWRYWVPTMQQLAVKYRCYALDLWGFGDSAKDPNRYHITKQIELIDKFTSIMGIPRVVLVGHGLGAVIAARFASDRKTYTKVHRLMVVAPPLLDTAPSLGAPLNTLASSTPTPPPAQLPTGSTPLPVPVGSDDQSKSMLRELRQIDRGVITTNPLREIFLQASLDELLRRATAPGSADYEKLKAELVKADQKAILKSVEELANINTMRDIMQTEVATCAVIGTSDGLLPTPDEQVLNQLDQRQDLKLLVIPTGYHFPMLEDNSQFVRLLKEFLEAPAVSSLEMKDEWRRRKR